MAAQSTMSHDMCSTMGLVNSSHGSHTMATTEQGATSTSPRTNPRPGSLVLLGILSRRRERLLTAAGNLLQSSPRLVATHETLDNLDELMDQYNHTLGLAIKLLGAEDPGILEALSFSSSLQEATSHTHMAAITPASQPTESTRTKVNAQSHRVKSGMLLLTSTLLLLSILDLVLPYESRTSNSRPASSATLMAGPHAASASSTPSWVVTNPGCWVNMVNMATHSTTHHEPKEKNLATDSTPQVMLNIIQLTGTVHTLSTGGRTGPQSTAATVPGWNNASHSCSQGAITMAPTVSLERTMTELLTSQHANNSVLMHVSKSGQDSHSSQADTDKPQMLLLFHQTNLACQELHQHGMTPVQTADLTALSRHSSLADTDKPQVMCTTTVLTLAVQTLSSGGLYSIPTNAITASWAIANLHTIPLQQMIAELHTGPNVSHSVQLTQGYIVRSTDPSEILLTFVIQALVQHTLVQLWLNLQQDEIEYAAHQSRNSLHTCIQLVSNPHPVTLSHQSTMIYMQHVPLQSQLQPRQQDQVHLQSQLQQAAVQSQLQPSHLQHSTLQSQLKPRQLDQVPLRSRNSAV